MTLVLQYALDAISTGSLYALLALGLAMTFGVARILNLAQSELIMLGAYAMYVTASAPPVLIVIVALIAPVVLAVAMERFAFRPLRGADEMTFLIASFGVSLLLQNIMTAIAGTKAKSESFGSSWLSPVHLGSVSVTKLVLIQIAVTVLLLVGLLVFFRRTAVGVQLRAAAADFGMAQMLGVRSHRMMMLAFAISGLTAAVAAIVLTAESGLMTPTIGVEPILLGLVGAVVGGLGSLTGAVVGGLTLGILTVVLQVVLPGGLQPYVDGIVFAFVFAVLMARPAGLFGRVALEREI